MGLPARERILFTGDLVENKGFAIFPYFPPDDADVNGDRWIEALELMERLDPAIVVPGHGDVGDVGVVTAAREYLVQLRDETRELAAEGLAVDDIVARLEPGCRSATRTGCSPSGSGSARAASTRRADRRQQEALGCRDRRLLVGLQLLVAVALEDRQERILDSGRDAGELLENGQPAEGCVARRVASLVHDDEPASGMPAGDARAARA